MNNYTNTLPKLNITQKIIDIIEIVSPDAQYYRVELLIEIGGYVVFDDTNENIIRDFIEKLKLTREFFDKIEVRR